jgi:thiol-disulfide isomerase/thioredoxin
MGSFSRRFDAWSYKRVKESLFAELVEPSSLGACLALCGGALLAALFALSALAYLSVGLRTETAMAPGTDAPLRLTLNVTFPQLPCHLAAVEVIDVLGRRRKNVTANLRKFRVDGETGRRLLAAPRGGPAAYGDAEGDFGADAAGARERESGGEQAAAAADPPGVAVRLTHETFAGFVGRYDVSLVAYGASWCPFSRKLAPVLDEVAGVIGGNADVRVALVDCADPSAMLLCAAGHIQAYPTMVLYRRGASSHSDVHYHGDRTAQAILTFLVAAQQDETLGREDAAGGPDGMQHGAEQHEHAERLQRELGLLPPDAAHPAPPPGGEAGAAAAAAHVHGGGSGGGSKPRDPADPGPALALIEAMHKKGLAAPGDVARAALGAVKRLVAGGGNGTNDTAAECDDPAGKKKAGDAAAAVAALGVAGGEGCQIAGWVEVARVPGSLSIVPPAADDAGLSVDPAALNLTHVVHELFFSTGGSGGSGASKQGGRLTAYQLSRLPRGTREELHRQAGAVYVSPPSPRRVSHEHYLSVVGSTFAFGTGHEVEGYRYSVASHHVSVWGRGKGTLTGWGRLGDLAPATRSITALPSLSTHHTHPPGTAVPRRGRRRRRRGGRGRRRRWRPAAARALVVCAVAAGHPRQRAPQAAVPLPGGGGRHRRRRRGATGPAGRGAARGGAHAARQAQPGQANVRRRRRRQWRPCNARAPTRLRRTQPFVCAP